MIRKLNDNIKDLYHLFKEAVRQFRAADPYNGEPLKRGVIYRGDGYTWICGSFCAGRTLLPRRPRYKANYVNANAGANEYSRKEGRSVSTRVKQEGAV